MADSTTPFRRPLSDEARRLFELGLDAAHPPYAGSDFSVLAELSIELEHIAAALFRAYWIQTGKQVPLQEFRRLSPELQKRYRGLAERAIATIDPAVKLQFQKEAAEETTDWLEGPGETEHKPTPTDIANYAVSTYEMRMCGVRIDMERGE